MHSSHSLLSKYIEIMETPLAKVLALITWRAWKVPWKSKGNIWIVYTELVIISFNAEDSTPCNPTPRGQQWKTKNPPSRPMHGKVECMIDMWQRPMLSLSCALSYFMIHGGFFVGQGRGWRAVAGGAQPPEFDSMLTISLYIFHNLPHNFPGTVHTLPYNRGQDYGYGGGVNIFG